MTRRRLNGCVKDKYGMLRDGPESKWCRERLWATAMERGVSTTELSNAYNVSAETILTRVRRWKEANGQI